MPQPSQRRLLRKHAGKFDRVLQIGGMWAPAWPRTGVRYSLFCDCTVRLGDGNPLSGVDFPSRPAAERWYRRERHPRRFPEGLPEGAKWLGVVSRAEIAGPYERASLFVLPSLFEASAWCTSRRWWKVPCIGTTACGMPEIILDRQTGRVVPPGDPEALADTVVELLGQPEVLRAMGERGRRHARERLKWPQVARRVDAEPRRLAEVGRR